VFFGGIGRFEAQLLGYLRAGGRKPVVFQAALDECEDFGLAWRQFQHDVRSVFLSSDWDYIQYIAVGNRGLHTLAQLAD
jgi:hypothetical protein